MDSATTSTTSNGLGKLLPKSITAKRRMKRLKQAEALGADEDNRGRRPSSREQSDDAYSANVGDDEDMDDRSFGSYESSADVELDQQPGLHRDS